MNIFLPVHAAADPVTNEALANHPVIPHSLEMDENVAPLSVPAVLSSLIQKISPASCSVELCDDSSDSLVLEPCCLDTEGLPEENASSVVDVPESEPDLVGDFSLMQSNDDRNPSRWPDHAQMIESLRALLEQNAQSPPKCCWKWDHCYWFRFDSIHLGGNDCY